MPRHFGFKGLHQHHFIYSCYGESSLENHKSFIIYRICIGKILYYFLNSMDYNSTWSPATYWTSGWIYGAVTASDYACAYYEYFSNWVDTMLLIYFLYQLGLILFEYKVMQNLVNNDLDEIVKHPSWKTLRGTDRTRLFDLKKALLLTLCLEKYNFWYKLYEFKFYRTSGVVISNNDLLIPNASWYHYIGMFSNAA